MRKNKLLNSSPPLSAIDILRDVIVRIDDKALLEFLLLEDNDPLKVKLRIDYSFRGL
jgi:hypothetical protein